MAPKRDFIDYANTVAKIKTAAELGGINDRMRQLAALERDKAFRQNEEDSILKREETLREAVFFYSEKLRDLEDGKAANTPVVTYILARQLKTSYERMPSFSSGGFRQFDDKQRLGDVQRGYDRIIAESAAKTALRTTMLRVNPLNIDQLMLRCNNENPDYMQEAFDRTYARQRTRYLGKVAQIDTTNRVVYFERKSFVDNGNNVRVLRPSRVRACVATTNADHLQDLTIGEEVWVYGVMATITPPRGSNTPLFGAFAQLAGCNTVEITGADFLRPEDLAEPTQ